MGCSGSRTEEKDPNEKEPKENNHALVVGGHVDKNKAKDLYTNSNTYITQCTNFFKKQSPPTSGEFNDDIFPHNMNSVFGKNADGTFKDTDTSRRTKALNSFAVKEDDIVWLRAKEIYENDVKIFGNKINIDDICQGEIGNCYLISTLSALAEFPEAIAQLFKTTSIPENGCVEIAIEIDGEWKIVLLDDYFPCRKSTKKPLFANARDKEVWPLFLEKAWAKVNGGYVNIISGNPKDVFNAFTPFSTVHIEVKNENKQNLWKVIKDSDAYNCIMTCAIESNKSDLKTVGLVNNHVFSLVSAFERKIGEETIRLMKIRNPWGKGEWNGKWSDTSDKWTDDAKKVFTEFDPVAKNDGIYWMAFEDFHRYFDTVSICVPITPLMSISNKVPKEHAIGYKVKKIKMSSAGVLTASIAKKHYRFHRKLKSNMEVIDTILIFKIEQNSFSFVSSGCNEVVGGKVTPGEYIVYYTVDYPNGNYDHPRGYTLNIKSDQSIEVADMPDDTDFTLLKSMLIPYIKSNPKYAERFKSELVFFSGNRIEESAIGFVYVMNNSKNPKTVKPKISLKNLSRLGGLPDALNLLPEKDFICLFIRVKANLPFQSGLSLSIPQFNSANSAIKEYPLNQETVKKYISDASYSKPKISFEYKQ